MAKDFPRSNQIGQQIKKEIAGILQFEVQHPTLRNVTVTDIELSKDLRHAKIYFISKEDKSELLKALQRSMSFIRQSLAKKMTTRGIPNLEFIYDQGIDHNDRITELLNAALKK
ncbi:MAG: 30S ribosome-binding factor RbfA [Proteobacteria bacterium]|jgi:ribosome-binding factor A|nr:30S ribosome-binding factor RbfA [Pseudomonadota bacterium]MDA0941930.1 30S ribosome-binding factor RbfA [Pseudomonadota bacterium]MDA1034349.1 30S ribosome-binding factor RbfA [Pseudomonadota bacterium]